MHADEVETDAGLVRRLLSAQFPQWSGLRVERVPSFGTDNALYRLGDDMVVRLPRIDWAASDIDKDARWLDQLGPVVPVAIPQQLGTGTPGLGVPWRSGMRLDRRLERPSPGDAGRVPGGSGLRRRDVGEGPRLGTLLRAAPGSVLRREQSGARGQRPAHGGGDSGGAGVNRS